MSGVSSAAACVSGVLPEESRAFRRALPASSTRTISVSPRWTASMSGEPLASMSVPPRLRVGAPESSGLAPLSSSALATSALPPDAASYSAVRPWLFRDAGATPARSNRAMARASPASTRWKRVSALTARPMRVSSAWAASAPLTPPAVVATEGGALTTTRLASLSAAWAFSAPTFRAISIGVVRPASRAAGSAPAASRTAISSGESLRAASKSAVSPRPLRASTGAPAASSACTLATERWLLARWSGVSPPFERAATSACAAIRAWTSACGSSSAA